MANIKKSFNFRNGVQVDDDNLKVSATGLVGIGTTVPTEALDVRGNLVVSGVSSAPTLQAGVATITTLNPTEIIGAGVSIKSGIVTASSGIITYFGDGINLLNLPTSQWEDTIVGAGVSSIYNTGGNVGIATTAALFTLQVGNDVNSGQKGVGISSFGDIKASGIITATTFSGNLTGNVTGNLTGNVTGNLTGVAASATQLQNARTIGGVSFDGTANINLAGVNTTGNQNTSGTAANLSGSPNINVTDLDVDGHANLDNVSVAGVTTFAGRIEGAATNNVIPFLYNNYSDLPSAGTYHGAFAHVHSFGKAYYAHAGAWFELVNKEADGRVGTGTETYNVGNIVSSGIITATTELNSPLIGVGTDAPANDIQVRKSGNAEIQVSSDTGVAGITVGREPAVANTNNAEFRYGLVSSGSPYSSAQSLDIINHGLDNFNYVLSGNNPGGATGDFHWLKGFNNTRLMTLTKGGNLGIGVTQPQERLTVAGVCTVTSNSFVGGNFDVSGNAIIGGNLTLIGSLNTSAITSDLTGNVTGNLIGNVNATSGISSFRKIGINTTVNTDSVDLDCLNANATFKRVGIGSTQPDGVLDVSGGLSQPSKKFIMLPKVSAGSTAVIQADSPEGGGLIYNTTLRKLQFFNGTNWETVTSVEVTG